MLVAMQMTVKVAMPVVREMDARKHPSPPRCNQEA
jgi:hypothetical protein